MIHSKISAQLHAIKVSMQILSEEFDIINTKCYQKLQLNVQLSNSIDELLKYSTNVMQNILSCFQNQDENNGLSWSLTRSDA